MHEDVGLKLQPYEFITHERERERERERGGGGVGLQGNLLLFQKYLGRFSL